MNQLVNGPNAWQRWLLRHLSDAISPQAAADVVNGVLRNYFVSRTEVLHFVSTINKAVKQCNQGGDQ